MTNSNGWRSRTVWLSGLGPKLLLPMVAVTLLVSFVLSTRATSSLETNLTKAFESKGEAIALALAAAAEQNVDQSLTTVQGSVDANKEIAGVSYIFLVDANGRPLVHTFTPSYPAGIEAKNPIAVGEDLGHARVKVNRDMQFDTPTGPVRAIDVAAPVGGGALGVVHVGMDPHIIEAEADRLRASMLGWGAIIAIAGIALYLVLTIVMVIRPVRALTRVTSDIVAKGDLTQTIAVRSSDEIGQLARTFGQMVERLREIPTSVRESTSLLSTSVEQLNTAANAQNGMVARQAAALQETQSTAQEIKQTSLLAAQKAEAMLKYAEKAEGVSHEGKSAVQQSVTALTDIRAQVGEIAERITALGARTMQIGDVTETVKDLADQSNMLALNAAIEAVRSGEHGKGFAVVAREIRRLADQSIQATKRVRENLEEISAAARDAVSITERGTQRIDASVDLARASGERFAQLSAIVMENSAAARQISAAVGQQNAGIVQIFTAVTEQGQMMDDTVKQLRSTEEAVGTLRNASKRLVDIVAQFRV